MENGFFDQWKIDFLTSFGKVCLTFSYFIQPWKLRSFFTTFFLGMVLTVPVGAFHRIYISFPFIALIISIGIGLTFKKIKYHSALILGLIFLFGFSNLISVQKMIKEDQNISILTDSVYLDSNYCL